MPNFCLNLNSSTINPAYRPYLFDYNHRYEAYYGGAGSGKSHFVAQKLLAKALTQKRKVLIVRKVARTLKDSCWQMCVDMLGQWGMRSYCGFNRSALSISLPNGSMILFKGLDDGEKIKSIAGITDIWAEEATELTQDDFTQLDLRLRAKVPHLQFWLSFNPVSKANWVYKYFFSGDTPANTFILKTTYRDNTFLPPEYTASLEAMAHTNPTYYRIYALGEFCSLDKLVYPRFEAVANLSASPLAAQGQLIVGLDFGYVNDASALIVARVVEEGEVSKILILDEVYKTGMLNTDIADMIKYKGLAKEIIIADSAEQKSIDEIKRLGIPRIRPAKKGQGSILQGIQRIQQCEIIVDADKCPNTIVELQNYAWRKDKSTNEYINEPIDAYNHALDALRYAMQAVDRPNKLQTFDKKLLSL